VGFLTAHRAAVLSGTCQGDQAFNFAGKGQAESCGCPWPPSAGYRLAGDPEMTEI